MKDVTTEQNSQKVRENHNSYNEIDALQHFYKQIGIPAVAAAVRYQGDAKNPAYAPVASLSYSVRLGVGGDHDKPRRTGHSRHRHQLGLVSPGVGVGATSVGSFVTPRARIAGGSLRH